ncbi:hypothetical protein WJ40_34235 [Burkholderia cepacia]|nr:hypothetical protein WJ40_34235 [Burkholderia cepacia]
MRLRLFFIFFFGLLRVVLAREFFNVAAGLGYQLEEFLRVHFAGKLEQISIHPHLLRWNEFDVS